MDEFNAKQLVAEDAMKTRCMLRNTGEEVTTLKKEYGDRNLAHVLMVTDKGLHKKKNTIISFH